MINFLNKKKKSKSLMKLFFLPALFLVAVGLVYYIYNLDAANSSNPEIKEFIIELGQGSTEISHQLEQQQLIKSALVFQLYAWSHGVSSQLQDGHYFLPQNLNIKEVVQILHRGAGTTKEKTLTFIEGWTNRQIAEYLSGQGFGTIQDFLSIVEKKSGWWDNYEVLFSRPKDRDLEGYLFPDTYRVYGDSAISDIIKKMLANLENKLTANLRLEIKSQDKTIHEILTLASILEKEVSTDYDRAMVADIFYKRIGVGMPLQADSTVNYVSGKSESRAAGIDLNIDNPYNTYKYNNLPPGPICNPGLSSIKAAVYPLKNNYWYFLTTPDGKVIYSETFEQHVAAKNKYY